MNYIKVICYILYNIKIQDLFNHIYFKYYKLIQIQTSIF